MKRAVKSDQRWRHILRVIDATFGNYLNGLVALRHGVIADMRRKLVDRGRSARCGRPQSRAAGLPPVARLGVLSASATQGAANPLTVGGATLLLGSSDPPTFISSPSKS